MPTYLAPGVFVEEVEAGSRPLEGVGTAVAAFVGFAEDGPFNTPTLVSNWTQFSTVFGGFVPGSYLAQVRLRLLPQRRRQLLHRPHRPGGTPRLRRARHALERSPQPRRRRSDACGSAQPTRSADAGSHRGRDRRRPAARTPRTTCSRSSSSSDGETVEEFDRVTLGRGKANVATVVNAESKVIRIEEIAPGAVEDAARERNGAHRAAATVRDTAPAAPPTTTSATSRTAPGSPASRRSTTSRCSPSPT